MLNPKWTSKYRAECLMEVFLMDKEKIYYVYAWYRKSTNEIFYIGKGKNNRYKETKQHRNQYFINTLNCYKEDCDVKILFKDLDEETAFNLEKELIQKYKEIGQCQTNLHEGGSGGNTGNYETVSKKLKEYRLTHPLTEKQKEVVEKMHQSVKGKLQTEEHKLNESIAAKKSWEDKTTSGNIARLENLKKYHFKKGSIPWNKGKTQREESVNKMLLNMPNIMYYEVYYNNELVYWCYGLTRLCAFCKRKFNISKTIVDQLINNTWECKFKKHKHLKDSLKILRLDKSVSTTGDECSQVEWELHPFEVRSSSDIEEKR